MTRSIRQSILLPFVTGFVITVCSYAAVAENPILVLSPVQSANEKYGSFTAEILKTEGFNEYKMETVTDKMTLDYLKKYDLVILTETALTVIQSSLFEKYVKEGGNLIAFRPDKKLSEVFGISFAGGSIDEGYLSIDTHTEIGRGIAPQTLQFHGSADRYTVERGEKIATLYKNALVSDETPAVVLSHYGKGYAMAFLFNLPLSIVYTRQGNYRNAGQEMDGITGIRPMDLFTDGWVDTSKNILNQTDEQMRLLSHGIEKLSSYTRPIPRFWYFPDTLKCLVTLNNDGEDSKEAEFQRQFEDIDSKGVKMTLYVKEVDFISKPWVDKWVGKGFEIAGHPDDIAQAVNPDWKTMDSVYRILNSKLISTYGVHPMRTVANHWFVWCGIDEFGAKDFSAQARIEEKNGILLDCNYAHYDNHSNQGHFLGSPGSNQGNYTGSGLIMRFSDLHGNILKVYQQLNNVYDQQYMEHDDKAGFYNCFKGLVDRSLDQEVYSYISVKAHNAEYFFSKEPLMKMLDYAHSRNIPVWTEEKLLNFLIAKDEASFSDIRWAVNNRGAGNKLTFRIKSSLSNDNGITCMVLYIFNGKKISKITVNSVRQAFSVRSIKGFDYAWITMLPGTDYRLGINYSN